MPQQEPEKKSAPAAQPIDMPDDEVLYELADLFRVFGDSTRISRRAKAVLGRQT